MSLFGNDLSACHNGVPVFENLSLSVAAGALTGLVGPSGVGKTTAGRILALLDSPTTGSVTVDGVEATGASFGVQRELRGRVAMIFQSPRAATDPRQTLARSIAAPGVFAGHHVDVQELAMRVGLTPDLLTRKPHQVSDGQLQRACMARALAQRPAYLICDEPTSMFDAATTASIMRTISRCASDDGIGVLVISHDTALLDAVGASPPVRVDTGGSTYEHSRRE